jgi:hypothetical protein
MSALPTVLEQAPGLNVSGWIMLIGCIGLVCGLCAFCFWKILTEPKPSEHHHAPLDIDTHDIER